MATERIEPPPKMRSPVKKPAVEKPVKQKAKGGRPKGRVSTPERKPVRKEPLPIPREDTRKKKGFCQWLHAASVCAVCCFLALFLIVQMFVHQRRVCLSNFGLSP